MSEAPARLGRPRAFDEELALDAVTGQFHARGYHATTLSDLLTATGLHKSSLYGAFGDKHRLLVTALDRYVDRRMELARADVESTRSPLEGLRVYLRRIAGEAVTGRGCLTANTAMELLPGDEEVARIVERHQRLTRDLMAAALDRAKTEGEVAPERPTVSLARYLYVSMEGLWELGRTEARIEVLHDIVDLTIRALR
ncbi:TetR/AcrR family transcriptional regulator [Sphaerisporangium fuscum]|uniref:TetR/AcrR family transcriptional regulator n=1 Tax=Sphaerisporangium fuscum TaxID=2835868 RepID=UPI001BDD5564|nr:TetR/AcrR family transcriptional regulator [Sphaerisporangium fuscum]